MRVSNGQWTKNELSRVTQQTAKYGKPESLLREIKPKQNNTESHRLVVLMSWAFLKAMVFKLDFIGRTAISIDRDERVIHKQRFRVLGSPKQII